MPKKAALPIAIAFLIMILPVVSANPVGPPLHYENFLINIFGVPFYLVMSILSTGLTVSILYLLIRKYKLTRNRRFS